MLKCFIFIFFTLLSSHQLVFAQIHFLPNVTFGFMEYTLEAPDRELKGQDNLPYVRIGGTLLVDRFFINGYAQSNVKKGNYDSSSRSNDLPFSNELYILHGETKFERKDYSVGLGYVFNEWFTAYLGYRIGETEDEANYDQLIIYDEDIPPFNNTLTSGNKLETSGYFLGINLSRKLGPGKVTLNGAVANLSADFTVSGYAFSEEDPELSDFDSVTVKSRTTGYTMGIVWSMPITTKLIWGAGVNVYRFKYDENDLSLSFEEKILSFDTHLSYKF